MAAINKWVIHTATGEFKYGGFYEPTLPQTGVDAENNPIYDPAYSIVIVPGEKMPDSATQKWNGSAVVDKTAEELAAYDAAQPLWIDGREVMRRLADSTHLGLERLSQTDATVCKLWNTLKAGGNVNVHSAEFIEGAAYLRTIGIPSVWPDVAAFDAELASQQRQ